MEDIEEYSEGLQRSFDRLQNALAVRLEASTGGYSDSQISELRAKIDELAERNAGLEGELKVLRAACSGWKSTCTELVEKLGTAVELVRAILRKESK